MPIRIVIADDHKIMRDGLRKLLEQEEDMKVVAEAEDGYSILDLAEEVKPDVIIMDVSMPNLNGIEASRKILARFPEIRIVALSMHNDKRFIAGMFDAGASAYLLKDSAFSQLAEAIRTVYTGGTYIGSQISDVVLQDYLNFLNKREPPSLTEKERDILRMVAEGKSTKEIAFVLNVSSKTVETHRLHIMEKINVFSIAGLTKYAIREGITTLEDVGKE